MPFMELNLTQPDLSEDFRLFLKSVLHQRCQKNKKYSMRAFAKALDMDSSTLSKIMSGKRSFGKKLICKISKNLGLDDKQVSQFVKSDDSYSKSKSYSYELLEEQYQDIASDWTHYALLELTRLDGFKSDPVWISKALGITVEKANEVIKKLLAVNFIKKDNLGQFKDTSGDNITNFDGVNTSHSRKSLQIGLLKKAIENISSVPISERSNTSMTMAIDTHRLPEAIEEIAKFRRRMNTFLTSSAVKDEVYNLSVSLSPLSNSKRTGVKDES